MALSASDQKQLRAIGQTFGARPEGAAPATSYIEERRLLNDGEKNIGVDATYRSDENDETLIYAKAEKRGGWIDVNHDNPEVGGSDIEISFNNENNTLAFTSNEQLASGLKVHKELKMSSPESQEATKILSDAIGRATADGMTLDDLKKLTKLEKVMADAALDDGVLSKLDMQHIEDAAVQVAPNAPNVKPVDTGRGGPQ